MDEIVLSQIILVRYYAYCPRKKPILDGLDDGLDAASRHQLASYPVLVCISGFKVP